MIEDIGAEFDRWQREQLYKAFGVPEFGNVEASTVSAYREARQQLNKQIFEESANMIRALHRPSKHLAILINTKSVPPLLRALRSAGFTVRRLKSSNGEKRSMFVATWKFVYVEIGVSDLVEIPAEGWWIEKPTVSDMLGITRQVPLPFQAPSPGDESEEA